MKNCCQLKSIAQDYQVDGQMQSIFRDLNLTIATDGITVILGKSGCGKTTLLRLLVGLEQPTAGKITYFDEQGVEKRPKIGMVFQEPRLFPWLTVTQNIIFHQEGEPTVLAQQLIERVGLTGYENAYPAALSGGMASRVAIARALAYEPDLLLMDEPFAALDYFTRLTLEEEVIRLYQTYGKGIVFVTHDVDEALTLGQKLLIMKKGRQPLDYPMDGSYPRDSNSPAVVRMKQEILAQLRD